MFERAKCSVQCALCVMRRLHAFGLCPVPCLRCHVRCAMLCTVYFCWVLCAAPGTVSSMPDQAVSCVVCPVSCALCPVPCTLLSALHPPPCVYPVVCGLCSVSKLCPAPCLLYHAPYICCRCGTKTNSQETIAWARSEFGIPCPSCMFHIAIF